MAELELRAVVCTRRLSSENKSNSEKHLQKELTKLKDKVLTKKTKPETNDSVMFVGEKCHVFSDKGSSSSLPVVNSSTSAPMAEDFEDEGVGSSNNSTEGSEPGSEGDRKKRCCDRYDSSESSDSGVVVLSSTDCSSNSSSSSSSSGSSACSSDILDPGSPYSSPTSAAVRSPEDCSSPCSEGEEDSSDLLLEPRPPDPSTPSAWPPFQSSPEMGSPLGNPAVGPPDPLATTASTPPAPVNCRVSKKRPYPFSNATSASTPKRFRSDSGNAGTIHVNHNNNINTPSCTSLLPYQQQPVHSSVNLLNNHQKTAFQQKMDSKVNLDKPQQQPPPQQQQQQQKWTLPKNSIATEGIKGQGKITEYFKTQIKVSNQKCVGAVSKKLQQQQQGKPGDKKMERFLRLCAAGGESKVCVQPVSESTRVLSLLRKVEPSKEPPPGEQLEDSKRLIHEVLRQEEPVLLEEKTRLEVKISEPPLSPTPTRRLSSGLASPRRTTEPPAPVKHEPGSTSGEMVVAQHADKKTEAESRPAAPLSPILSAPRVIRFPVPARSQEGTPGASEENVRCCWTQCSLEFRCASKLLEHLQNQHVNPQNRAEKFVCLWVGCKVHARESCSLSWLERHVLSHGGSKPFRCIVEGCGQRFSSQLALERHVNNHFNASGGVTSNGNTSNGTRRSVEAPNKLFKRNGKKLRYRRQPWSARMFDYIDTGMMEGVQHRLLEFTEQQMGNVSSAHQEQQLAHGNHLALRSTVMGRRVGMDGTTKVLVRWTPPDILPDEWLPESEVEATKLIALSELTSSAAATVHHTLLPPQSKVTRKPRKPLSRPPSCTDNPRPSSSSSSSSADGSISSTSSYSASSSTVSSPSSSSSSSENPFS